jgi:O-antigen ligase
MLATIGLLSRIKQVDKFKKRLTCLAIVFLFSFLLVRIFETNLLGNLVLRTSAQLLNVTFMGSYGLYLITEKRYKKIGQLIAIMAWVILVISFTKFYFIPIILLPLTWALIETRNFNRLKRFVGILIIIIIITSSLFIFRDNITSFATSYPSFNAYWHGRVVDGSLLSDGGLRDGSRFRIWNDLLQQFYRSPWLGIGYGARPTFLNVADHNIFIFFLVRFGAPIFITLFILTFALFVHMLSFVKINRMSRLVLFSLLLTYFLTSAIDPKPYAVIINSLLAAVIAGVILNTKSKTVFLTR